MANVTQSRIPVLSFPTGAVRNNSFLLIFHSPSRASPRRPSPVARCPSCVIRHPSRGVSMQVRIAKACLKVMVTGVTGLGLLGNSVGDVRPSITYYLLAGCHSRLATWTRRLRLRLRILPAPTRPAHPRVSQQRHQPASRPQPTPADDA